ncbi:MAG: GNAT family N-acetyltransferase [Exiguobacterium sp.]|nr:GNAT family N-acetyltransferase [Exiguobacterium sp.]
MPGTIDLRTDRMLLRRHVMEDAEPLHEGFGIDPAMFEYSGWNPYATLEMARKTVADAIESYADSRFYGWAIEHEGRLVGTIGAYDFDPKKGSIEVGMSIERASWGKGFATEALSAVLRYLTEDEEIATVTAWCASDNVGSRFALEKAGMVQVGVEAGTVVVGGAKFDKLWFEFQG